MKHSVVCTAILLVLWLLPVQAVEPHLLQKADPQKMEQWTDSVFNTLTPDERNRVWLELERKYRPWNDFETLPFYSRGAGWQRQLHIYEAPFYYIDYCLAQMAALQFFAASLADRHDAWQRYLALVKKAGSDTYAGLVRAAGFAVPFEPGAIEPVAKQVAAWCAEKNRELA